MAFTPCNGCAQPAHCGGRYPDDDKHRPGQLRGCFGEKSGSIRFTSPYGQSVAVREKVLDGDLDAYARLRKDGVQPNSTDGARKLEATL